MPLNTKAIERRIKQHIYAKEHRIFAVVHPGFEGAARAEIESIAAVSEIEISDGGIEFTCGMEEMWKLHLASRCATRFLMRVGIFRALFWNELREKCAALPWELYLDPVSGADFSITCHHSKLYHTGRISQEIYAAISERFASQGHDEPVVEGGGDSIKVFVRFQDDVCTLSVDCTGEPLYRRGYKIDINEAPLRETLAASILFEAGISAYDLLVDPMCGSGTIPVEGAMFAGGVLPGFLRTYAFKRFPFFPEARCRFVLKSITDECPKRGIRVFASDIDERSLDACRWNAGRAKAEITIERKDFFSAKRADYPEGKLLIAMNPPYGERLGPRSNVGGFFAALGGKLRKDFAGCGFAVIVPGEDAERAFGIRWDRKIVFSNGGLKVALLIGKA